MHRRAKRILGSAHEAEDIVQELFELVATSPERLPDVGSLAGWFYATTTNRCLNRIRDRRNRERLLRLHAEPPSTFPPPEAATALRELLRDLPDELATVAIYYYGDEMTHDEIARLMGCSRRHVGDLIERLDEGVRTEELSPCL